MSKRPSPRKWSPKNPEKYVGSKTDIVARSSWEIKVMNFLDTNPSVISWNSEGLVIKYISPLDGKFHRYFVDFIAKFKTKTGEIKVYAIEVKPSKEQVPPKPNKNRARFIAESETYLVNQAKWKAATEYCQANGVQFIVLNEFDLGIK